MGTPIHTTTEHKIGTIIYLVVSAPSENAAETLDKKVEKLIRKEVHDAFCLTVGKEKPCYSQKKSQPSIAD